MKEIEITYRGINLLVVGEYIDGEEPVYNYGGGDGYPGSNADFIIDKVFVQDTDIYDLFSVMDLEEIVELVISSF